MNGEEAERLWAVVRSLEKQVESCATKADVLRLHESFSSLEESVRESIEYQRDSVVVPVPPSKVSIIPFSKMRGKMWEWVALTVAILMSGAVGAIIKSCTE